MKANQVGLKIVRGKDYNYCFNQATGDFVRWGKTEDDDPLYSPIGPEILDIEISTICHQGCSFCYKSNTTRGRNMTLDTFKQILAKIPKNLTQIAFGIGSIDANPDLWKIMAHTREMGYVPNITINGSRMNDARYRGLANLCGAVAVSNYGEDRCYETVQDLNFYKKESPKATLQQVNIHQLLSVETLDACWGVLEDMQYDKRLKDLNAVVFLLLKPKGDRNKFHPLRDSGEYKRLIEYALKRELRIGFDSCSAPSFLRAVKGHKLYKQLEESAEPCESTLFSLYINVDGKVVPCSFCDGEQGIESIDMLKVEDFMKDVWYSKQLKAFRGKLIDSHNKTGCRECPMFNVEIRE